MRIRAPIVLAPKEFLFEVLGWKILPGGGTIKMQESYIKAVSGDAAEAKYNQNQLGYTAEKVTQLFPLPPVVVKVIPAK